MKKINTIFITIVLIFVFVVLIADKTTFGAFENHAEVGLTTRIANWNILVNGNNITYDKIVSVNVKDVTWNSGGHTSDNKVAPGSKGTLHLNIDPTGTDTAIVYSLEYIDNKADNNYILTVNGISNNSKNLIRTADKKYSAIITMDEIKSGLGNKIDIEVEWVNDESNNDRDSKIGLGLEKANLVELKMHAEQYKGETLNAYVE